MQIDADTLPLHERPFAEICDICGSKPQEHRGPVKTGAERSEQNEIAWADTPLIAGLAERERDRRRAGIAVVLDVDDDPFDRHGERLLDRVNDSQIRLNGG